MQISAALASLAVLAGSIVPGVSARCHTSGIFWPNAYHSMAAYVETECRRGAFTGTFKPGEVKYKCIQYGSGVKLEFSITNKNTRESFDLQDDHCIGGLRDEIYGCSRGGISEKSGWVFSSDPNEGRC
ncbi:hypothetical protein FDECE_2570 [Fusarium decemcellulare]|nr:hypothetical protein FDECE_2570 [Fusarium decemcellulare]